jgi:predicted CopG family antitoxin
VIILTKYATISVPADVKKRLEKAKGKKEWGEFILDLYTETQKLKSKKAFNELAEIVTAKDLKVMAESSREFREKFAFR